MKLRFEQLESRIALSHAVADHIHARLTIEINGSNLEIPANIGLGDGHFNPHTHASDDGNSNGILHIGEGGAAGLSNDVRYVTLDDFFDVWREAGGAAGNNPDAFFSQTEIMGHTVDDDHELTMTVNGEINNQFENYVPHDDDDITIKYARLSSVWHNYDQPLDVSGDGHIVPRDALLVINKLIANGSHEVDSTEEPSAYYDTNNDGYVSPLDALLVINYLNRLNVR